MKKCEIQLNSIDCYFFRGSLNFSVKPHKWANDHDHRWLRPLEQQIAIKRRQLKEVQLQGSPAALSRASGDSTQGVRFLPMNYWTLLRTYQIQILYLLSWILSNFSTDFLNVQVSQIHDYYARGISTNFCYWGTAWKWIFPDTSLICLIQILKSGS